MINKKVITFIKDFIKHSREQRLEVESKYPLTMKQASKFYKINFKKDYCENRYIESLVTDEFLHELLNIIRESK